MTGDHNHLSDLFVRDMTTGAVVRASVGVGGQEPDADVTEPALSTNGRYAAFLSKAGNVVTGDGNGAYDVFVRDLVNGTTTAPAWT